MDHIDSIGYAALIVIGIVVIALVDHWFAWVSGGALVALGAFLIWQGRALFERPVPPVIIEE